MSIDILGISGSPIPDSNTDRLVLQVLQVSGLEYEFVKLSHLNIEPCRACQACEEDNICKTADDFPELVKKIIEAQGLVIGADTSDGTLDGLTKVFLERLCSTGHLNNLSEPKYIITIILGSSKQIRKLALESIAKTMALEKNNHVAQINCAENLNVLEDPSIWGKAAKSGKLLAQYLTEEIECWLDYE